VSGGPEVREWGRAAPCPSKVVEITFWHTIRMPDEYRSIQPRRDPSDGAGRAATDQKGISKPLCVMIGSAGLVIAWFEIFWRHYL
jgi:hypothetical protein